MKYLNKQLLSLKRFWYLHKTTNALMADFLTADLPAYNTCWTKVPWLVVDLETTALQPAQGEVASIGWVPIDNGVIKLQNAAHYYTAIKEGVGQSAIYHQIRDVQLCSAVSVKMAMEHLLKVAAGRVLVFHYAQLDLGFLNKVSLALFNTPLLAPVVDTLLLERHKMQKGLQQLPSDSLRLHNCRRRYGLPNYPAHDALTDALATAELLIAWIAHYGDRERVVLGDCLPGLT